MDTAHEHSPALLAKPNYGSWSVLSGQCRHPHSPGYKTPLLLLMTGPAAFGTSLVLQALGSVWTHPNVGLSHVLGPLEPPSGTCGTTDFREGFNLQLLSGGFVSHTLCFSVPGLSPGSSPAEATQRHRASGTLTTGRFFPALPGRGPDLASWLLP